MAGRIQQRRRGRGLGLGGLLVERDEEIAVLEERLAEARSGRGGVIVIDGPAGTGKSRLLTVAGDMGRAASMHVLGAQAIELERDFPFGVAIQLFEPPLVAADPAEREALLDGPARRAAALLSTGVSDESASGEDHGYGAIHGLFWLSSNLCSQPTGDPTTSPLVMMVDDAQWADRPSMRFLAYLAERIDDLPIVLVVAVRPGEQPIDWQALGAVREIAGEAVLRPAALTEDGVSRIVRDQFPDAEQAFCETCGRVTGGNPLLLVKLLEQVQIEGHPPDAATAARLAELPPDSVLSTVMARLGGMSDEVRRLASAVAILGDGALLCHAARMAMLDVESASEAADTLAAAHLLHPGTPLSFVHPLIRSAVRASLLPIDRGRAHRRAAQILIEAGTSAEQVAVHLLAAPPETDPGSVEVLREAARKALANGASESAIRLLERALAEQPPPEVYPELLAELGQAESVAGWPRAAERLEDAIKVTDEKAPRAQLAIARARALSDQGRFRDAAYGLATALDDLGADTIPQATDLEAAFIATALLVPELAEQGWTRAGRMLSEMTGAPSDGQRYALAQIASQRSLQGENRNAIVRLVDLAWGDGALLGAEGAIGRSWPLLTGALLFVDELERDLKLCTAALELAREESSPAAYSVASFCRAWPLYEQGRIVEAAADAQAALDARPDGWHTYYRAAYGAVASCHLERGLLAQAEKALAAMEHPEVQDSIQLPFLLDVRAKVRLAQLRAEEALQDASDAARRLQSDLGTKNPGAIPWRSTAALAHLALGDRERAYALAADELEQAQRIGVTRIVIRDLRILGLAEGGARGIDWLTQAVQAGTDDQPRLEYIYALVELGGALRRANQRVASREPLRIALELSSRGGARALAERARTELAATGARPRRVMRTGVESLTPSERRVADLAARGLTTRQVAEALFVSPKTVEFHLRHVYRKLDIGSRAELAKSLGGIED